MELLITNTMEETLYNTAPTTLMTLGEAIKHCNGAASACGESEYSAKQLLEQMANWLEELKKFRSYANQIKQLGIQNENLCIKGAELKWLMHNTEIPKDEYLNRICEVNTNLLENELTIYKLTSEMISLDEITN